MAPLRFDHFMEAALLDPAKGYYSRRITAVGRGGDFTTTPMISPAFASAIASWALQSLRETGCRDLIELGPGEGVLAGAVLAAIPWWSRRRIRLHLVERSLPLRQKQAALLGRQVHWHQSMEEAIQACGGRACIWSNEFADAFPVRVFRRNGEGWDELFLAPGTPGTPVWCAAMELPDSSVFREEWPTGQVVEVHESFHQWWHRWLSFWRAGRMLTIDYGCEASTLYHRRPGGSLRGYFHQQRIEGPMAWANPGRQDLTADVNFSDLAAWPHPWAVTRSLQSQREFLLPFVRPGDTAGAFAVDPAGAGGAFLAICHQAACTGE